MVGASVEAEAEDTKAAAVMEWWGARPRRRHRGGGGRDGVAMITLMGDGVLP